MPPPATTTLERTTVHVSLGVFKYETKGGRDKIGRKLVLEKSVLGGVELNVLISCL